MEGEHAQWNSRVAGTTRAKTHLVVVENPTGQCLPEVCATEAESEEDEHSRDWLCHLDFEDHRED
jgi:hypothetical protein